MLYFLALIMAYYRWDCFLEGMYALISFKKEVEGRERKWKPSKSCIENIKNIKFSLLRDSVSACTELACGSAFKTHWKWKPGWCFRNILLPLARYELLINHYCSLAHIPHLHNGTRVLTSFTAMLRETIRCLHKMSSKSILLPSSWCMA